MLPYFFFTSRVIFTDIKTYYKPHITARYTPKKKTRNFTKFENDWSQYEIWRVRVGIYRNERELATRAIWRIKVRGRLFSPYDGENSKDVWNSSPISFRLAKERYWEDSSSAWESSFSYGFSSIYDYCFRYLLLILILLTASFSLTRRECSFYILWELEFQKFWKMKSLFGFYK